VSPWCSTDAHETPLPLPCKVHTVAQPINKLSLKDHLCVTTGSNKTDTKDSLEYKQLPAIIFILHCGKNSHWPVQTIKN
jgi:hypothetical protein